MISQLPLLVQGTSTRRALIEAFRSSGNAVLVGSISFWEGIDIRGDALSLVVIDKLPFAPPDDPVVEAKIRYLRKIGRNPFNEYQLPEAIMLMKQGVGRLIRDETDRGVLMILDERVVTKPYGKVDSVESAAVRSHAQRGGSGRVSDAPPSLASWLEPDGLSAARFGPDDDSARELVMPTLLPAVERNPDQADKKRNHRDVVPEISPDRLAY